MKRTFIYLSSLVAAGVAFLTYKKKQEIDALKLLGFEFDHVVIDSIKPEAVYLDLQFKFTNSSPYQFIARNLVCRLSYKGTQFALAEKVLMYILPATVTPGGFIVGVPYQQFVQVVQGTLTDPRPVVVADVDLMYHSNTLGIDIPIQQRFEIDIKDVAKSYFQSFNHG